MLERDISSLFVDVRLSKPLISTNCPVLGGIAKAVIPEANKTAPVLDLKNVFFVESILDVIFSN
ncbi:hypothetical protein LDG_6874 [Legionella drancourtii LLAP12]|uniref:Uncharacterized protein n=1 Tax=Legionella drancourtii LLAP12 TaxID=658187 RepID=G9ENP8_9GAMM|nr:hypothetical protein LDG_6874 [Legionella drancourtii LLAP12]